MIDSRRWPRCTSPSPTAWPYRPDPSGPRWARVSVSRSVTTSRPAIGKCLRCRTCSTAPPGRCPGPVPPTSAAAPSAAGPSRSAGPAWVALPIRSAGPAARAGRAARCAARPTACRRSGHADRDRSAPHRSPECAGPRAAAPRCAAMRRCRARRARRARSGCRGTGGRSTPCRAPPSRRRAGAPGATRPRHARR